MEIEAKILEVDVEAVVQKLLALGAEKTFDGEHEAYRLDDDKGSIREAGELLRVRKETQDGRTRVMLTYKKAHETETTKQAEEFETEVASFEQTSAILASLGYSAKKVKRKHRLEYSVGKVHFCLDTMPGIPTFLEIEAPSEEEVVAWAERLGFSRADLKPWTGSQVSRHYGK